jgi:hypothetical protein
MLAFQVVPVYSKLKTKVLQEMNSDTQAQQS